MSRDKPQLSPQQCLREARGDGGSPLARVIATAGELERVDRKLRGHLPAELAVRSRVANLRNGVLVLAAESSAWAARLRYLSRDIVQTARKKCRLEVHEVEVRVSPTSAPSPQGGPPPRRLSRRAAEHLRNAADTAGDPELAALMQRLAGRAAPEDKD